MLVHSVLGPMASGCSFRLPDMWKETYDLVSQVPEGMVTTYGHVAEALGDRVAARFVGLAMSKNDDVRRVPCRRVVHTDGRVGGYTSARGPEEKTELLEAEGIRVASGRVVDLEAHLFTGFKSSEPLRRLRAEQRRLASRLWLPSSKIRVDRIAGVDIAYHGDDAFVSVAVLDPASRVTVDTLSTRAKVRFPYIPTYLAYRELPLLGGLVDGLDEGTVLMYDGNGVLHPEGFGIASHAGVVFALPTIGIAKKKLCGTLKGLPGDELREVEVRDRLAGYAISSGGRKPIFASPGHGISFRQSLSVTLGMLRHRVPEPVRQAHLTATSLRQSTSNK
jgi:deoxyribonuclease V